VQELDGSGGGGTAEQHLLLRPDGSAEVLIRCRGVVGGGGRRWALSAEATWTSVSHGRRVQLSVTGGLRAVQLGGGGGVGEGPHCSPRLGQPLELVLRKVLVPPLNLGTLLGAAAGGSGGGLVGGYAGYGCGEDSSREFVTCGHVHRCARGSDEMCLSACLPVWLSGCLAVWLAVARSGWLSPGAFCWGTWVNA
jgi:hypothetical protein